MPKLMRQSFLSKLKELSIVLGRIYKDTYTNSYLLVILFHRDWCTGIKINFYHLFCKRIWCGKLKKYRMVYRYFYYENYSRKVSLLCRIQAVSKVRVPFYPYLISEGLTKLFDLLTGTATKPWLSGNMLPNISTCENG